jgi:Carboxypeptidase regulatory-like domain
MDTNLLRRYLCAAVLLIGALPVGLYAQAPARSLVIASVADAASGKPLENAQVTLSDAKMSATTDWSGEARIANVAPGKHTFQVRHPGYAALDIDLMVVGDSIGPVFRLASTTPSPLPALEPVTVNAKAHPSFLKDFDTRRAQGIGKFLTADDLAGQANRPLITVVVHAFSSLMAAPDPSRTGHDLLMTRRSNPRLEQSAIKPMEAYKSESHCGVDIYLNGSQFHDDLESLRTADIAGIEYYAIGSAPGEYRRPTDSCGVLLLWTKQ